MRFPEADVQQLLQTEFDRIESLWEADPYQELLVWAVTVKEFMKDHAISVVNEGLEAFKRFKVLQAQELGRLGFGSAAAPAPDLAAQPA